MPIGAPSRRDSDSNRGKDAAATDLFDRQVSGSGFCRDLRHLAIAAKEDVAKQAGRPAIGRRSGILPRLDVDQYDHRAIAAGSRSYDAYQY